MEVKWIACSKMAIGLKVHDFVKFYHDYLSPYTINSMS